MNGARGKKKKEWLKKRRDVKNGKEECVSWHRRSL